LKVRQTPIATNISVATSLWAVFVTLNGTWIGHRSAHWTDSSCGEPVATAFTYSL
jgi:hypothetical protein